MYVIVSLKIFNSFISMHKISTWVVCVNGKHLSASKHCLLSTALTTDALIRHNNSGLTDVLISLAARSDTHNWKEIHRKLTFNIVYKLIVFEDTYRFRKRLSVLQCLSGSSISRSSVQYRKWSPTVNDPETANDPQNGPQMILDRKWSLMSVYVLLYK